MNYPFGLWLRSEVEFLQDIKITHVNRKNSIVAVKDNIIMDMILDQNNSSSISTYGGKKCPIQMHIQGFSSSPTLQKESNTEPAIKKRSVSPDLDVFL